MPVDYRCGSCGLTFTVGWFSYESADRFAAETDLVCTACGTCHRVQHAVGGKTPDLLSAQHGP